MYARPKQIDRDAAEQATLTNLLQRQGYEDLDAVLLQGRQQGLDKGHEEGLANARRALRRVLDHRKLEVPAEVSARIDASRDLDQLDAWLARALDASAVAEIFDTSP